MFHHAARISQNKVAVRIKKDAPTTSTKVTKRKKTTVKSEVEPIEIEPWLQRQRKWRRRKERKPIQAMTTNTQRSLSKKRNPRQLANEDKNVVVRRRHKLKTTSRLMNKEVEPWIQSRQVKRETNNQTNGLRTPLASCEA
ncbi:hypothetical protein PRIPAC_94991 [Pristionchus pacificus]|uniref:Uncharacterized protein n=1 Tax=Pristionchus pacificus TaxID=54126 RepID=A0A2A6BBT4_PRIPA|nr:hypothetical protein PRIPAC_94991 [Pristionchus pacificus]|eukprot:PDM63338.1 hypothetical protein PRIPAC_50553 [Pristionchus pacificus]